MPAGLRLADPVFAADGARSRRRLCAAPAGWLIMKSDGELRDWAYASPARADRGAAFIDLQPVDAVSCIRRSPRAGSAGPYGHAEPGAARHRGVDPARSGSRSAARALPAVPARGGDLPALLLRARGQPVPLHRPAGRSRIWQAAAAPDRSSSCCTARSRSCRSSSATPPIPITCSGTRPRMTPITERRSSFLPLSHLLSCDTETVPENGLMRIFFTLLDRSCSHQAVLFERGDPLIGRLDARTRDTPVAHRIWR